MATTIYIPSMLRGAGTRGIPEMPAGSSFTNTYSFTFDGADDLVNCGDLSAYDTGDLSVSVWVYKTAALPNPQYVISNCASSGKAGFDVIIDRYGSVAIRRNTRTVDAYTGYVTSVGFTLNNWHHITGTYKDSTKTVKLYVDGALKDTTVGSTSVNAASTDLTIGSATGGANFFVGRIDEVSIYSAELSAAQVSDLYNSGIPGDLSSLSPVGWWRMGDKASWDGTDWTLIDQGSGGNNGTSDNMEEADRTTDIPS